MRDVNQETITGTLSWYKILLLSGFNLIRAKQRLHMRRKKSLSKFLEPSHKPKVIKTHNSLEFGTSCEDLAWNHRTSTPQRSETNGIAERAVRRVKEDTSAVLLQTRLDQRWWADSMERRLLSAQCPRPPGRWQKLRMKDGSESHLKDP